ncbi:hypothetical protein FHS79_001991 [Polymorphobacter multimanifer]|uniref:Uncharacterized protein n=1 Tax=Polymorphobacter multimanifer TaxID=1070431 RepID=A0A841L5W5_9SPHN|nr:hypothetical protein [Polymorphobacter multimanifer]
MADAADRLESAVEMLLPATFLVQTKFKAAMGR